MSFRRITHSIYFVFDEKTLHLRPWVVRRGVETAVGVVEGGRRVPGTVEGGGLAMTG